MDSYTMESVDRGYHIYKEIWSASIGMSLGCERETFNPSDPYAVAMTHNGVIVGHVPRNISGVCSAFLRRGETMTCVVAGVRQYSSDLLQGGLEVPCKLTFSAPTKEIQKLRKLLSADRCSVDSSASLNRSSCSTALSTTDPASST